MEFEPKTRSTRSLRVHLSSPIFSRGPSKEDVLRRPGRGPAGHHVEEVHEEVVGQRAGAGGEEAFLVVADIRTEDIEDRR